jgi:hypothetical protein
LKLEQNKAIVPKLIDAIDCDLSILDDPGWNLERACTSAR